MKHDPVNHPKHYTSIKGIECIQVTENFNFCKGNAIKYIWRSGQKDSEIEDLRKAIWYINREIKRLESIYKVPENELLEHCTADMPSADTMYHNVMNLTEPKIKKI